MPWADEIARCIDTATVSRERSGKPNSRAVRSVQGTGVQPAIQGFLSRRTEKRKLEIMTRKWAIPLNSDEQKSCGCEAAQDAELEGENDLIEGVDEDGNKVLLEVVRYFYYNGEEYVVLGDAQSTDDCDCEDHCHEGCDCCHHDEDGDDEEEEAVNLYIMKVVQSEEDGEDMEEFVPVEDEALLDKLIKVVETDFAKDVAEE